MTDGNENERAGRPRGILSRRRLLQGTAGTFGAALASVGIYEVIDSLVKPPHRPAVADSPPIQEQYILQNEPVVMVNGSGVKSGKGTVAVRVPALHDHVITARLNMPVNAKALQEAQHHLESVLLGLERQFPPTPTGVATTVAWGLPYFHRYIPTLGKTSGFFKAGTTYPAYLPVDLMTSKKEGHTVYALQEARTFPSDQPPPGFGPVRLEQNDLAVLLRSDSLANIKAAQNALFGPGSSQAGSLFKVTSIRQGFSGGGFYGQQGLPSKLALAADIPGAKSIPRQAQGFLGFATTLDSNMGPGNIANLETLPGLTDQWPNGYFKQGTTMHLSHLFQDLVTWYEQNFPQYADRVQAMLQPGLSPAPAPGTLALQPPGQSEAEVAQGVQRHRAYGHTGSMSEVDSTTSATTSNYGKAYPAGTTIPVRGDFDTLDNPFHYTSDPTADHYSKKSAAGLHFISFQPTTEIFNRVRLAMDGHYPDRTLPIAPRSPHAGINSVLQTTHRQNYLVPPRRHRSFPLAEFLA
ncbi:MULTISPECIES: hypothetical protein [unclassified Streptomyces]|uniref:DUF7405 family protein n=1 Tax=unclassified Streptomyces TaxID=2593676 RepID=UPI0029BEBAE2|nr:MULTISPECIES: hypothetical protein [unclassified Streptomyces]MDX3766458.1 hypothetical protein [Streptomyces sp. AK08-01B]MDX3816285.1 hypothetical protein [Streptomyces sp. AK08-01A]